MRAPYGRSRTGSVSAVLPLGVLSLGACDDDDDNGTGTNGDGVLDVALGFGPDDDPDDPRYVLTSQTGTPTGTTGRVHRLVFE